MINATHQNNGQRRASKGYRKRQLIEATIHEIARCGLSDLTLSGVASSAGLSQGIINLHFSSKENLLTETLSYLRDDYTTSWQDALSKAPDTAEGKLAALVKSDYSSNTADPKKLAVWFAFWGEAKARPTYKKICVERMKDFETTLKTLLHEISEPSGAQVGEIDEIADGIMAMADGLWLNILLHGRSFPRQRATKIMMQHLARTFPVHRDTFLKQ
ncbi:HTH-type transcriptional regulator BetI [Kordiimonas sediminis]|uniref:HTH-type transcriptional regulator BetI n=1 Tax=Kordiimonas sediminis TaxID=1735581 RepID=A0A919E913_9PROT|nr:TetR family transcriptional regulator C-terminal domain-containing protein [Kordiimonas sediminis]GHF26504.1 HTH-type transcriptional regulator BetI [Kordiimonas sediminis]